MDLLTVILIAWQSKNQVIRTIEELKNLNPNIQIIIADNGSIDGLNEYLELNELDYVYFDEGIQTCGKVLNFVMNSFVINDKILVMYPHYRIGKNALNSYMNLLERQNVAVVGACYNNYVGNQNLGVCDIDKFEQIEQQREGYKSHNVVGSYGECFAFKKQLYEAVGGFDENIATLEYTMIDYQLRAIKGNFENILGRDICLYNYNDYPEVRKFYNLLTNEDVSYVRKKWNMNYFGLQSDDTFVNLIARDSEEKFSVLEIGCDIGAHLLGIKNAFPNCQIHGVELNEVAVELGRCVADIRNGNIEDKNIDFGKKFDYIIFGDVLEHLHDPKETIIYCRELLNEGGRIIASIPNLMHISVMKQLLRGEFKYTDMGLLDRTHIHFFTYKEIINMFNEANYAIEKMEGKLVSISEEEKSLEKKLLEISEAVTPEMYETYQFLVVVRV